MTKSQFHRLSIEPTFFAGLFDGPLLDLKMRAMGHALLFDSGKLSGRVEVVVPSGG